MQQKTEWLRPFGGLCILADAEAPRSVAKGGLGVAQAPSIVIRPSVVIKVLRFMMSPLLC